MEGFLKSEKSIFISCLGEEKFFLITEKLYLFGIYSRWLEASNNRTFEYRRALLKAKNKPVSTDVLREIESLGVLWAERHERYNLISDNKSKSTQQDIKILKEMIDLLKEMVDLKERLINILSL